MPINILNIGQIYEQATTAYRSGYLVEAERYYRLVISISKSHAGAFFGMGAIACQTGRPADGVKIFTHAIQMNPKDANLFDGLGESYRLLGQVEQALHAYNEAIKLNPLCINAYNNSGVVYAKRGEIQRAVASWESALLILGETDKQNKSEHARAMLYDNIASTFLAQGRVKDAIQKFEAAQAICPHNPRVHSNLLRAYLFSTELNGEDLLEKCRYWWQLHAANIIPFQHFDLDDSDRPLRVGFVSPDFRHHAIGSFLVELFEHHDRSSLEFLCYSNVRAGDDLTKWFAENAKTWRNIAGMPDKQAAEIIRRDNVDILVDLVGHGEANRLLLFAYKPAPIQVSYLGYPGTTGCPVMDYRITDGWADPINLTESHYSEELWRLPRTAWCHHRPPDCRGSNIPPSLRGNQKTPFTFGSFNNFAKVNENLIRVWSGILGLAPHTRLLLKAKIFHDQSMREQVLSRFMMHGARQEQIVFSESEPSTDVHLARYDEVDLALDPFPYQGTTTTCEALEMNVPVLVLAGSEHVSRVGISLLTSVDLCEYIADTEEKYITTAIYYANNPQALLASRNKLRQQLESASIWDGKDFASSLCAVFWEMWRKKCSNR